MKIDKYAVQVQGVLNLLPSLTYCQRDLKVRKITLINVNTYPVPKISKYLNLIIFDKHNLSL